MSEINHIDEAPSAPAPATPLFDHLYDTVRDLGAWEVAVELIPHQNEDPGLALIVRRTDDGSVVHRATVRSSVEEAARRIRKALDREATQAKESE